uniref:Uncharacterized protein n=1 Tax=Oryza rufipogon TaxID=4529 RepID=A0A0E0RCK7_ORYRU
MPSLVEGDEGGRGKTRGWSSVLGLLPTQRVSRIDPPVQALVETRPPAPPRHLRRLDASHPLSPVRLGGGAGGGGRGGGGGGRGERRGAPSARCCRGVVAESSPSPVVGGVVARSGALPRRRLRPPRRAAIADLSAPPPSPTFQPSQIWGGRGNLHSGGRRLKHPYPHNGFLPPAPGRKGAGDARSSEGTACERNETASTGGTTQRHALEGGPHLCNVAFTDSFVQFPDPISWATLVGIGSPPSAYDLYSSQNMYGAIISISLLGRFSVNNISSSGQHSPQNICKLLSSMQIV